MSGLMWFRTRLFPAARHAAALRLAAAEIKTLNGATEKDFLAVGAQFDRILGGVSEERGDLERVRRALDEVRDDILAGELEQFCGETEAGGEPSSGCAHHLRRLMAEATAARPALEALSGSVRMLRVMGVTTRIESVRLGEQGAGFETLAAEVVRLADAIDDKAAGLVEASRTVEAVAAAALARAERLESEQAASLPELTRHCREGAARLSDERRALADLAGRGERSYRAISNDIAGLVTELQMHDSVRQRTEHAASALILLAEELEVRPRSVLAAASRIAELQRAQIEEAYLALTGAVQSILSGLGQIAHAAAEIADGAGVLAPGGSSGAPSRTPDSLASVFSEAQNALAGWARSRQAISDAAALVASSSATMASSITEIERIGASLLRLSLNAETEAAHLGARGAVLEAVASGIRGVARDAAEHADRVSQSLAGVQSASGGLAEAASSEAGRAREEMFRRLSEHAGELARRIDETAAQNQSVLSGVASSAAQLVSQVQSLCGSIQAHHWAEETRECCSSRLAALAAACAAFERDGSSHALLAGADRYTMQAERHVHSAVAGDPAAAAAAAADAGDNVELF
ncbi:MAG: hypothetical protein SFV54_06590 [Bryobacteraceae bacterium]|nr:hypothetical protein [Bryobacteraceae bacterium]